jgi:uncharacterized protein
VPAAAGPLKQKDTPVIDGMPVIEAVAHAHNFSPSNYASKHTAMIVEGGYGVGASLSKPGFRPPREQYLRDWSIEEVANMLFLESDTDLAVYHVLPIKAYKDGGCRLEKGIEANERWPDRFITYCGVDPMEGQAALDEMDRQVELLHPVGVKLYPDSWVGDEARSWLMDDPEIAYPIFERARQLGLHVVAIHKAVPMGAVRMQPYKMDDIDRAAMDFPDLNFEVVHGGMAFIEESAWQIARFPNVYLNLEITSAFAASRPLAFAQVMAGLVSVGGATAWDKILWGTGAMSFHPRPLLEAFVREFAFDPLLVEKAGLPEVTDEVKRKVLFDNYATMSGLDLRSRLEAISHDEFTTKRAGGPPAEPYSTTSIFDYKGASYA